MDNILGSYKQANWRLILGFLGILLGIGFLIYFNIKHKEFALEIEGLRHDLDVKISAVEKMKAATLGSNYGLVLLPRLDDISERRIEQRRFTGYTRDFLRAQRQLSRTKLTPVETRSFVRVEEKISELDGPILTALELLAGEGNTQGCSTLFTLGDN
jgi:hypothetical protein